METTWIFQPEKLHRKKYVEKTWVFRPLKLHRKKHVGKKRGFFDHRNYTEKSTWKQRRFFDHRPLGLPRIDIITTSRGVPVGMWQSFILLKLHFTLPELHNHYKSFLGNFLDKRSSFKMQKIIALLLLLSKTLEKYLWPRIFKTDGSPSYWLWSKKPPVTLKRAALPPKFKFFIPRNPDNLISFNCLLIDVCYWIGQ